MFTTNDFIERAEALGFKDDEDSTSLELSSMMWDAFPIQSLTNLNFEFNEEYVMKYLMDHMGELGEREVLLWQSFLPKLTNLQLDVIQFLKSEEIEHFEEADDSDRYFEFDDLSTLAYYNNKNGDAQAYVFGTFTDEQGFLFIQNFETNIFLKFKNETYLYFFLKFYCEIEHESHTILNMNFFK